MSKPFRVPSHRCVPIAALLLTVIAACGGNEPVAQAPAPPSHHDRAAPGQVTASAEIGGLNEEEVDKTFRAALTGFQRCLDDGSKRVEFLGGSVSFFVKLDSAGRVEHAHLEKSTIGDRETEKCMLDRLRDKRWPKPVGGLHGLARKAFDFDPPNDVRKPASWDGDRVSPVVSKLSSKLNGCKKGARGSFEATLYVATDGSVLAAGVTPPDEAGDAAVDCLVDTLKGATWPSPGSWPAIVSFSM